MNAFKEILIHDITPKGFADVYAQTIAYGMFAARLHDPTLPTFSRQEAAELIPKSNPFLRKLFAHCRPRSCGRQRANAPLKSKTLAKKFLHRRFVGSLVLYDSFVFHSQLIANGNISYHSEK
jgi:hypothetical protein